MICSKHSGWGIHCDIVNPKLFELQVAKEILAKIYDIQIAEVDDLVHQHIVDFRLTGIEFNLYTAYRRSYLS